MKYYVLASGSKGNSIFIYDHGVGILIDCGISKLRLKRSLESIGYNEDDIKVILLTHRHSDHIKGIKKLDPNIMYGCAGSVDDLLIENYLEPYEQVNLLDYLITPLKTSHDAPNSFAYIIDNGQEKLLYMSDTGYVSKKNIDYITNLDYYLFEANHDIEMLMATNRPYFLKQKIIGDKGHLDNVYSATVMAAVIGDKTKELCLVHLSEQANSEEVVRDTYSNVFNKHKINFGNIIIAKQDEIVAGTYNED